MSVEVGSGLSGTTESQTPIPSQSRRPPFWRWFYFVLLVAITAVTLVMMIRSGNATDSIAVMYRKEPVKGSMDVKYRCWVIESSFGQLGFRRITYLRPELNLKWGDIISFKTSSLRSDIFDLPRIGYLWILGLECIALFFMVPSVISKAKR